MYVYFTVHPSRLAPAVQPHLGHRGLRGPPRRERRLLRHDQRRHHAESDQVGRVNRCRVRNVDIYPAEMKEHSLYDMRKPFRRVV